MNAEKNASISADPIAHGEVSSLEESKYRYTSDSYQKVLDYHVGEILLTAIVFGVILLLRLHH